MMTEQETAALNPGDLVWNIGVQPPLMLKVVKVWARGSVTINSPILVECANVQGQTQMLQGADLVAVAPGGHTSVPHTPAAPVVLGGGTWSIAPMQPTVTTTSSIPQRMTFIYSQMTLPGAPEKPPGETPEARAARWKAEGVCPQCGDKGQWIVMAVVCPKHGPFIG